MTTVRIVLLGHFKLRYDFGAIAVILDHTEISFTFAFLSTTACFGIVESMVDHSHSISSYSVRYSLAPPR